MNHGFPSFWGIFPPVGARVTSSGRVGLYGRPPDGEPETRGKEYITKHANTF
jgi:hypothetical protein